MATTESGDRVLLHHNRAAKFALEALARIKPVWIGTESITVYRTEPVIAPTTGELSMETWVIDPTKPDIDLDAEEERAAIAQMVESQEPDLSGLTESDQRAVMSFAGDQKEYADSLRLHAEVAEQQRKRNKDIDAKVFAAKAEKMEKVTPSPTQPEAKKPRTRRTSPPTE